MARATTAFQRQTPVSPPEVKRKFGGSHPAKEGRLRLVNRKELDSRTLAARKFDAQCSQIKADLGNDISTIELALVETFCGASVMVDDYNVRILLGKKINLNDYCLLASTMVRVATRLGLKRRAKDVSQPALGKYLAADGDTP